MKRVLFLYLFNKMDESTFFTTVLELGYFFLKGYKFKNNDSLLDSKTFSVSSSTNATTILNTALSQTKNGAKLSNSCIAFSIDRRSNTIYCIYKYQFFPEDITPMSPTEITNEPATGVYLIDLDKFHSLRPPSNITSYRIYNSYENSAIQNKKIKDFEILDNSWCWLKFSNYLSLATDTCNCGGDNTINGGTEYQITLDSQNSNKLFFKPRRTQASEFDFSACDQDGTISDNWLYLLNRACDDWGGLLWYGLNTNRSQRLWSNSPISADFVNASDYFYPNYRSRNFSNRSVEKFTVNTDFSIDKLRIFPCSNNSNNCRLTSTDNGAINDRRDQTLCNQNTNKVKIEIIQPSLLWILKSNIKFWGLIFNICAYYNKKYKYSSNTLTDRFLNIIVGDQNICTNELALYCASYKGNIPNLVEPRCIEFCKTYECNDLLTAHCDDIARRTLEGENVNIFDANNKKLCGCAFGSGAVNSAYDAFLTDAAKKGLVLPTGPNCGIKEYTFPPCMFAKEAGYTTVDGSTMGVLPECNQDIINCISNTLINNEGTITGDVDVRVKQRCYTKGQDDNQDDEDDSKPPPKPTTSLSTTAKVLIGGGVTLLLIIIIVVIVFMSRRNT